MSDAETADAALAKRARTLLDPASPTILDAVRVMAEQWTAGPDGCALRDGQGAIVPAWPEACDAFLQVSAAFWNDDTILSAAANLPRGRLGLTRIMTAAAAGDSARIGRLIACGAQVNRVAFVEAESTYGSTAKSIAMLLSPLEPSPASEAPYAALSAKPDRLGTLAALIYDDKPYWSGGGNVPRSVLHDLCAHSSADPGKALLVALLRDFLDLIPTLLPVATAGWDADRFYEELICNHGDEFTTGALRELCTHPLCTMSNKIGACGSGRSDAGRETWLRELAADPDAPADNILWAACSLGLRDLVDSALDAGADPNVEAGIGGMDGLCCLQVSSYGIIRRLLEVPTINAGDALLCLSSFHGLEDVVRDLLDRNPLDLIRTNTWSGGNGTTTSALAVAARGCNLETMRLLLSRQAPLDFGDFFVLEDVICEGDGDDVEVVDLLLANGASTVFNGGYTALYWACQRYPVFAVAHELLDRNIPGCEAPGALHVVVRRRHDPRELPESMENCGRRMELARKLHAHGHSTTAFSPFGNMTGGSAIDVAHPACVKNLLKDLDKEAELRALLETKSPLK